MRGQKRGEFDDARLVRNGDESAGDGNLIRRGTFVDNRLEREERQMRCEKRGIIILYVVDEC